MKVLVTDAEHFAEADVLTAAGHQLVTASMPDAGGRYRSSNRCRRIACPVRTDHRRSAQALPQLRLVSRYGVGVDIVDTAAAQESGVWVQCAGLRTEEVAHAVAMLALMRNLAGHDREVRSGRWDYQLGGRLRRPSLLTLGVVGLGRIGRMTAERAGPWFGAVVGYDPYPLDDAWPNDIERLDA